MKNKHCRESDSVEHGAFGIVSKYPQRLHMCTSMHRTAVGPGFQDLQLFPKTLRQTFYFASAENFDGC
jgi:hypothetical protein